MPETKKAKSAAPKRYKKITLEDLHEKRTFQAKSVAGVRSMKNGLHYTVLEKGERIGLYRYCSGKRVKTLFDVKQFGSDDIKKIADYAFSEDETRILLTTGRKKIYRHSFTASFHVYNTKTRKISPVSQRKGQQLATLSPDGRKVAFVSANDLFISDLRAGKETRVTRDGRRNRILNGVSDWAYEEEFFMVCAHAWSPDSKRLAWLRFDESKVRQFNMTLYEGLYLKDFKYKYPKAGEKNSVVTAHVYDLKSRRARRLDTGKETDQYLPRIRWTKSPGKLMVLRMNRLQNRLDYLLCDAATGRSEAILTEENARYIELEAGPIFLEDRKHFLVVSEANGYRHIYLHDMRGRLVRQITRGEWDVTGYLGCDEKKGIVYYESAEVSPLQRHAYRVGLDGAGKKKLTPRQGTNRAVFGKGHKFFINYHSSANSVPRVSLHDSDGKRIRILETNAGLKKTLKDYRPTPKEFFSFTTSEGVELNAWMINPPRFNRRRKYPVLMTVYGGPNSQTVRDTWGVGRDQLLAQEGYIVVSVDNRGTGARGEEFRKCTYGQLGKLETIDQIEAAKHLASLPFVDASRIGISGWSYGGFMAANCMFLGADVFKLGVVGAPVTHYRYYDSIYTERYMGLPRDNPDAYNDHAPLTHAGKLKGELLIVHGTGDDNVHVQNTMDLITALIDANKQFQAHLVPNKDHGVSGGKSPINTSTRITNFILERL